MCIRDRFYTVKTLFSCIIRFSLFSRNYSPQIPGILQYITYFLFQLNLSLIHISRRWLIQSTPFLLHPIGRLDSLADKTWPVSYTHLCDLYMCGMVKPSFIPPADIRQLRDLVRYRFKLTCMITGEKNRAHNLSLIHIYSRYHHSDDTDYNSTLVVPLPPKFAIPDTTLLYNQANILPLHYL